MRRSTISPPVSGVLVTKPAIPHISLVYGRPSLSCQLLKAFNQLLLNGYSDRRGSELSVIQALNDVVRDSPRD